MSFPFDDAEGQAVTGTRDWSSTMRCNDPTSSLVSASTESDDSCTASNTSTDSKRRSLAAANTSGNVGIESVGIGAVLQIWESLLAPDLTVPA